MRSYPVPSATGTWYLGEGARKTGKNNSYEEGAAGLPQKTRQPAAENMLGEEWTRNALAQLRKLYAKLRKVETKRISNATYLQATKQWKRLAEAYNVWKQVIKIGEV